MKPSMNLEKNKEKMIELYQNGLSINKIAKKYNIGITSVRNRFIEWEIHKPRTHTSRKFYEEDSVLEEIKKDRESGMTFRYLEKKYGLSYTAITSCLKGVKGKFKKRMPEEDELERLIEDLNSDLYFLDELSHFYILPEMSILEVAHKHKCIVNFDYDNQIDFLMQGDKLSLTTILSRFGFRKQENHKK